MKHYDWVLFDADDTLFHFDAFSGLRMVFASHEQEFTVEHYQAYQAVNKGLWVEYQNGVISAAQLKHRRFETWAAQLNISPQQLNTDFLNAMADISTPLEGAISLLNALQGKAKLGIITNGFIDLQQARLERTGLHNHFDIVVISEAVGAPKPSPDIFNHALALMQQPKRDSVLMVGDTLESDILGGLKAGFDTCWLNRHQKMRPEHIQPHYEVSSLMELERLLRRNPNDATNSHCIDGVVST